MKRYQIILLGAAVLLAMPWVFALADRYMAFVLRHTN